MLLIQLFPIAAEADALVRSLTLIAVAGGLGGLSHLLTRRGAK